MTGRLRVIGTALVANALRPLPGSLTSVPAFFAGWLTAELAPHLLVMNGVDTARQLARRRYRDSAGRVGLALSAASMAGLAVLIRRSQKVGPDVQRVLDADLPIGDLPQITAWRDLAVPFRMRNPAVTRVADIQYAPGGMRQRLDVYHRHDRPERAPVLLQIHGGGWTIGRKDQQGIPLMLRMAARGWVCVAPNYRLSPKATWPDHLVDVKRALAWVREQISEYGGDPSFVAVTGGSAGGHLAAMMALTANDPTLQPGFEDADTAVQACVPHYGVYDFANVTGSRAVEGRLRAMARLMFQRDWRGDRTVFEEASPICRVRADAPPFFVIHGHDDTLVPVAEARQFVERLRAASTSPVLYAEVAGAQHAFDIFPSIRSSHVVAGVERFLDWTRHSASTMGERAPEPVVAVPVETSRSH